MTTQTAINAQSMGTGANIGNGKFSIAPLTLAATTTGYVVNAKLVNGVGIVRRNQPTRIWYTTSLFVLTAAAALAQLQQTAHSLDIVPAPDTAGTAIKDGMLEPATGPYFYCWVDAPTFDIAAALTVTLVELP